MLSFDCFLLAIGCGWKWCVPAGEYSPSLPPVYGNLPPLPKVSLLTPSERNIRDIPSPSTFPHRLRTYHSLSANFTDTSSSVAATKILYNLKISLILLTRKDFKWKGRRKLRSYKVCRWKKHVCWTLQICRALQSAHFATAFFASAVARTRGSSLQLSAKRVPNLHTVVSVELWVLFKFLYAWSLGSSLSELQNLSAKHKTNKKQIGKAVLFVCCCKFDISRCKSIKEQTGTLLCLVVAARLTLSLQKTLSCLFCGQLQKQICCYKVHVCRTRETRIFFLATFSFSSPATPELWL